MNTKTLTQRRIVVTDTEYVCLLRRRLGLTQKELGKRVGISRVYVNFAENGMASPERTARLANELEKMQAEAEAQS